MACPFCNIEFNPLGLGLHKKYCKSNPNRSIKGTPRPTLKGKSWNRGLTTSESTKRKISIANTGKCTGKAKNEELEKLRKLKISKTMKTNKLAGGLRKGSGRGKAGYYKGYWCDSSWELAWVIFNLDNNIKFTRCKEYFNYTYNGQTRKYYPDFKIDDTYIEIKGYMSDQFIEKVRQFPNELKVLEYEDLKHILKYVIDKYGLDYCQLYESKES